MTRPCEETASLSSWQEANSSDRKKRSSREAWTKTQRTNSSARPRRRGRGCGRKWLKLRTSQMAPTTNKCHGRAFRPLPARNLSAGVGSGAHKARYVGPSAGAGSGVQKARYAGPSEGAGSGAQKARVDPSTPRRASTGLNRGRKPRGPTQESPSQPSTNSSRGSPRMRAANCGERRSARFAASTQARNHGGHSARRGPWRSRTFS
mmetsp:Transcript_65126/g.155355  ORF Transcript_65126/g.155355 Transcript_65126/m.155355 type:complete len:206 (+) Transcript_65126:878-1495(+)